MFERIANLVWRFTGLDDANNFNISNTHKVFLNRNGCGIVGGTMYVFVYEVVGDEEFETCSFAIEVRINSFIVYESTTKITNQESWERLHLMLWNELEVTT